MAYVVEIPEHNLRGATACKEIIVTAFNEGDVPNPSGTEMRFAKRHDVTFLAVSGLRGVIFRGVKLRGVIFCRLWSLLGNGADIAHSVHPGGARSGGAHEVIAALTELDSRDVRSAGTNCEGNDVMLERVGVTHVVW